MCDTVLACSISMINECLVYLNRSGNRSCSNICFEKANGFIKAGIKTIRYPLKVIFSDDLVLWDKKRMFFKKTDEKKYYPRIYVKRIAEVFHCYRLLSDMPEYLLEYQVGCCLLFLFQQWNTHLQEWWILDLALFVNLPL